MDGLGASHSTPPNVWKPSFPLAYGLALVVLERAAHMKDRRWPRQVTLALLIGFLGLVDEAVAPIVLVLWVALDVVEQVLARRERLTVEGLTRVVAGPALAALLLAVGGGVLTAVLGGRDSGALSLGWIGDRNVRQHLLSFSELQGGLGLLSLGSVVLAGAAAILARRDPLTLAVAAAAGTFVLAALTVQYGTGEQDVPRLDGDARNFALLAALLALSLRLRGLQPRWRWAASAAVVGLVTWPTVVSPIRALGPAIGQGVEFGNARTDTAASDPSRIGSRSAYPRLRSEPLAAHIRDHTGTDARILSPDRTAMSAVTGRPSAAGFTQVSYLKSTAGPEYQDALRYLQPDAVRRLGIAYVHATDAWMTNLPHRARGWLDNPQLLERVYQDGGDALYRVQPAFLELTATPARASYAALRQALPSSAVVYVSPDIEPPYGVRLASALAHTRLAGELRPASKYLQTIFGIVPLGEQPPAFIAVPHSFTPSMLAPAARRPIWWNAGVAVYATDDTAQPLMRTTQSRLPPVTVRTSDEGRGHGGETVFSVELIDRAPDRWTGQDWLVLPANASGIPHSPDSGHAGGAKWLPGQFTPGQAHMKLTYDFDPRVASLRLRAETADSQSIWNDLPLAAGHWTLVLRLSRKEDRGGYVAHEPVALVPILLIRIAASHEVSYSLYEGELAARLGDPP